MGISMLCMFIFEEGVGGWRPHLTIYSRYMFAWWYWEAGGEKSRAQAKGG